jgi:predicted  nucleic acid-binding Zn-ribbon protein
MYKTGDNPGTGKYRCTRCGTIVVIKDDSALLQSCPGCHNTTFERAE